jgi:hypothetical protein
VLSFSSGSLSEVDTACRPNFDCVMCGIGHKRDQANIIAPHVDRIPYALHDRVTVRLHVASLEHLAYSLFAQ